ncbi:MAG: CAP domain-containing protein, partial [Actinomycetota bacterium]|nr:CAP domain-containing protein [Actinomycetota bacterium]
QAAQPAPAPAPAPPTTAAPPPTTAPPAPRTVAAASPSAAEGQFLALVNQVRAGAGLPALRLDGTLQGAARSQAQRMAGSGNLVHQNLAVLLGPFRTVGENVGYGPNVSVIHNALVNSPGHFANMVKGDFTSIGIGVSVDANGTMWTSHVFGG